MNTLAEGIRFAFKLEKQDGGRGIFANVYALNGNKDGESLGQQREEARVRASGGSAKYRGAVQRQNLLRVLLRLPRRIQRQPQEVREVTTVTLSSLSTCRPLESLVEMPVKTIKSPLYGEWAFCLRVESQRR